MRFSLNVWVGIIGNAIVGPIFIEGRLTGANYLNMLRGVIEELLDEVPLSYINNHYYQHDGAPPHYTSAVRDYLNDKYGESGLDAEGPSRGLRGRQT